MAKLKPFTMPKWGIEMAEGTIADWMVAENAPFTRGTVLTLIETDKITNEVEAEADGRFVRILAKPGETYPVGALLASTLLKREGCAVETAASGHEALDALKRARYDLVFMDMRMPGMDGPSAARAIRARGDETPIVALTANAFAEDRRACLEAGMDDHLVKPLELDALRASLARWTKSAEPHRDAGGRRTRDA